MEQIPYIAHEAALARMERTIKRLWILCLVLIVLLVGTNIAWLIYESQFEDVVTTEAVEQQVEADNVSGRLVVNGIGNIYGESESEAEGD